LVGFSFCYHAFLCATAESFLVSNSYSNFSQAIQLVTFFYMAHEPLEDSRHNHRIGQGFKLCKLQPCSP
jgi:hypothetical protein